MDGIKSIRVYPLAPASTPLAYVDITETDVDVTHLAWEDNLAYWQKLHEVIEAEPVQDEFRPMYGLLAELGIAPGKPFAPDARMKSILERAARAGRDQMLVSSFDSNRPDRMAWADRRWEWASLVYDNGDFETPFGLDLEARDRWYAQAILGSPAMFRRHVGSGSLYWLGIRDRSGDWLDGSKTYKLTVPLPVPARLFWSVTVYDNRTRSQIKTDQNKRPCAHCLNLHTSRVEQPRTSTSGPPHPRATRTVGSRPFRIRAGSPTSASTVPKSRRSTPHGNRGTSNTSTDRTPARHARGLGVARIGWNCKPSHIAA
jgi:hypothetical protein